MKSPFRLKSLRPLHNQVIWFFGPIYFRSGRQTMASSLIHFHLSSQFWTVRLFSWTAQWLRGAVRVIHIDPLYFQPLFSTTVIGYFPTYILFWLKIG